MKAAQLKSYSKEFNISINEIPIPEPMDNEVLIRVKASAINPLEILTATGKVKLIAGNRYYSKAKNQGKEYRFMFVRSDGSQLREVTKIVEKYNIVPSIDPHIFSLEQICDAMKLVAYGKTDGKVIIRF